MILNTQDLDHFPNINRWRSCLEQRSSFKRSSLYQTGAYLLSALGRIELEGLHQALDTSGTGIGTMEHSTSSRTMHTLHPQQIIRYLLFKLSHQDQEREASPSTRSPEAKQRYRHQHLHQAYGQRHLQTQSGQASYSSIAGPSSSRL